MQDDPYQKLLALAHKTAAQLKQQGKASRKFTGDDGSTIEGWVVDIFGFFEGGDPPGSRVYERWWGDYSLILTVDGLLYIMKSATEVENANAAGIVHRTESHTLLPASTGNLVGRRGEPFSETSAKLKRLPWS